MNKKNKLLPIIISAFLIFSPCYVEAVEEEPTSSPTPTPTATATSKPIATPTPTPTPTETSKPTTSPTPTATATPKPTTTPTPTATPEIEYKITLNKEKLELDTEKSETLTAKVTPESELTVLWKTADETIATVDKEGKVTAGKKAGKVKITAYIINEDKETLAEAECTVEVTRELGKDATLKQLKITNGSLDKTFKPDVLEYKVTITSNDKALVFEDLDNSPTDSRAQYLVLDNEKLKDGSVVRILVTAEDEKTKNEYKLTIVKDAISLDLKSLKINGYALNETFNANTLEYTADIPYEIEVLTIQAAAKDSDAKVKVTGNTDLKLGENTVKITVSDSNGNTKIYKIIAKRAEKETVEENKTSIITSSMVEDDTTSTTSKGDDKVEHNQNNSNDDGFLKYAIVSLACLILFAIGGIGIYFYLKTSPKKLKKVLTNNIDQEDVVEESPVVEVTENSSNIKSVMDEKLVETREFKQEDLKETENLFDEDEDV